MDNPFAPLPPIPYRSSLSFHRHRTAMTAANLARLLLLSAIWGASFMLMRISVPAFGPALLIFTRVALAALFLSAVALYLHKALQAKRLWKHYLVLGLLNSGLPFLLFAYAAQTLSASLLSVLNACAPLWASLIGAVWLRALPAAKAWGGLLLGVLGVSLLVGVESLRLPAGSGLALAAGLGAAFSYGLASIYTKNAPAAEPFAHAHGSMWAAMLLLTPLALLAPSPPAIPGPAIWLAVLALGVVCSGVAYLLYFRLVLELGAASALTVTFLIPVFGIVWGALFLQEHIGWHTLAGTLCVLSGTALVTGFSWRSVCGGAPKAQP
ncbi:DMT family transporter [Massilia sp. W12]|uniref:DMT family transporter n=1 Tax=Massilia sp. W12 TaxID=3126507 RepID=UPI0030D10824